VSAGRAGQLLALGLALLACRARPIAPAAVPAALDPRDEIVVLGRRVPLGTLVVPWFVPGGHDAHDTRATSAGGALGLRYRPERRASTPALAARVAREGWTPALLAEQVDLFVIHYDACGTSAACFRTLQEERGLSAHFLLDVDGTLYQTLDLAEEAWHARAANPRSIGVEVAHVGAYPCGAPSPADAWYARDARGTRLVVPDPWARTIRTPGFAGRPARPEPIVGPIHGADYLQYDFTLEQYAALAKLAAGLARIFPRIALDAPRGRDGSLRTDALTDAEEAAFHGILGHFHLQEDKRDPGPAFDWERFLAAARGVAAPVTAP
jgi:N-acetyl-anhydromuramyl-L-alanine amidase AmpD